MGASSSGTPATFTTNDVIGIAFDADAGTLVFYKNGTLQTGGFTGITAGNYSFIVRKDSASGDGGFLNCGQRPFSYTPPSGFVALNTQNLPTPTISNGAAYMAATTYTGTGATQSISNAVNGISFQPDFVWFKSRATTFAHALFDSVRGVTKGLSSNDNAAEFTSTAGNDLAAFTSTGFTVGAPQNWNSPNNATSNPVAWQWNAGGSTVTTVSSGTLAVASLVVSNTSTSPITCDVYITRSAVNYYIVETATVAVGGSLEVIQGNRIILQASDALVVVASASSSADAWVSGLTVV
jgi:hypothetical protein